MTYLVKSNYFSGSCGVWSNMLSAREGLKRYLSRNSNVVSFADVGNYTYEFTTKDGKTYYAEIYYYC